MRPRNIILEGYLSQAPIALGLVRAVECAALARLRLENPLLDIGCGDGLFMQVLKTVHPSLQPVGVDTDAGNLR